MLITFLAIGGCYRLWLWCQKNIILKRSNDFRFLSACRKTCEGSLHPRLKSLGIRDPPRSQVINIERRIETEIILSPVAALELNRWLIQHIQEYEATFGSIVKTNNEQ